jgi:flavin reductase (DIM6/NTAB) family NADH-FMN oxidoreductase RutF
MDMGEKIKRDVEYLEFMWPMRHFLITCGKIQKEPNIIALSFCMPVSKEPPLIACAIGKNAYSCSLIEETKEFIVNVPPSSLEKEVHYCGYHSGRDLDKFSETGLTPLPSKSVDVPIISECIGHMECKVVNVVDAGDKKVYIGKVVEAYADEEIVTGEKKTGFVFGKFPRSIYGTRFTKK